VAWSALLNPRVKKVSPATDWFIIGGTEGICWQQEREAPHAGRAVAGRDILYAPVVAVRSDLVPDASVVNENPVRLFGFNQACEQLEFRLEILITHRRGRLFPLDPDDSRVFIPENLEERIFVQLCCQRIGPLRSKFIPWVQRSAARVWPPLVIKPLLECLKLDLGYRPRSSPMFA
jgi:hypothetical protein